MQINNSLKKISDTTQHSSRTQPLEDCSNRDIIDVICSKYQFNSKCKTKIRCILGIEFEKELIELNRLTTLLNGKFVLLEHSSKLNTFSSYDGVCMYNKKRTYFEVKSTFSTLGAFKQADYLDVLVMNNVQYSELQKLIKSGYVVIIFVYYYPDDILVALNFSDTDFLGSTSDVCDAGGEKTFYGFSHHAVIEKVKLVLSKECRLRIRNLQWQHVERHSKYCTADSCNVQKYTI